MRNILKKLQRTNIKKLKHLPLFIILSIGLYVRFADLGNYVTPDEPYWMNRSNQFLQSVLRKDWEKTLFLKQSGNETRTVQGIITRWVTGISLLNKGISREHLRTGQISISLTTLLLMGILSYFTGILFQNKYHSIILFLVLLLDAFLLSLSRVVHVDSLLTLLLLISVVTFLLSLKKKSARHAIISGVTAGMAVLQKAPALSVLPFAGVASLAYIISEKRSWKRVINLNLIWMFGVLTVIFLLYPALWVKPTESIKLYFASTFSVVGSLKNKGNSLQNKLPINTGVIVFYVTMLLIKSTLVQLTGLTVFLNRIKKKENFTHQKNFYLLLLFAGIFTLQMSTGKVAVHRYILPVHVTTLIIASWGLADLWRKKETQFIVIFLIIIQSVFLIQKHPYSFLYINPVLPLDTYDSYDSTWGLGVEKAGRHVFERAEHKSIVYTPYPSIPAYTFPKNQKHLVFSSVRALPCPKNNTVSYIILSKGTTTNPDLSNFLKENSYRPEKIVKVKGLPVASIFKTDKFLEDYINSQCLDL